MTARTDLAVTGIKLDREPSGKYPGGKAGARRLVRRAVNVKLRDPRGRDSF